MAIIRPPGWMGLSIVNETGQHSMRYAAPVVRLREPVLMSQFAGLSKEIPINIGYNENFDSNWLIGVLRGYGSTPVVLNIVGHIASNSVGAPCLNFPGDLQNAYIRVNIGGGVLVMGRGGAGGGDNYNVGGAQGKLLGQPGGHAIYNGIGTRLQINNAGTIGGGGGGGGGVKSSGAKGTNCYQGGGGGQPMGAGGTTNINGQNGYHNGASGNMGGPGAGAVNGHRAGSGGGLGSPGGTTDGFTRGNHNSEGGAAGTAVYGSAPNWIYRGSVAGPSSF